MKQTRKEIVEKDVLVDVICNICKNSCKMSYAGMSPANPEFLDYLSISKIWGYFSDWDNEEWEADICINCVKQHLEPLMNFSKRDPYANESLDAEDDG